MINTLALDTLNLSAADFIEISSADFSPDGKYIVVVANSGGINREQYFEQNERIRDHPDNVADIDLDDDSTKISFVFAIPDRYADLVSKMDWSGLRVQIDKDREAATQEPGA